ncbi:hypothetical protein GKZ68_10005 [Hymenobacter sp. BRD128]|uniref:hypothetical protein n=1 Tax=Hymenobacter sp. BRD128 TaxID=2675878 RepID=UPI0015667C71|nr:hypothetical protein [Hymenobacter sp. BRD128]QKG56932.1 hypothetical protein GKZ68_10005 [Hymenobacter sp. BRD128]
MPSDSLLPFSAAGLRGIFQRWKYLLGLALGLAAVISTVVAWSLPNIYSSTAVFLPTSPQSTDPDRLVEGSKLEVGARSEDLDRVLTIGQSLPLAEQMIRRFNLYEHYHIGQPGTDAVENNTLAEFNSNLSIVHNERDAIELTFEDRDKKLAAAVANAMVTAIDSINQQLTLVNRRNVLEIYRQRSGQLGASYERTRQRLIAARRRYGIFGLEQQGRYLGKAVIDTEKELRMAEAGGPGNAASLRRALRGLTQADGGNVINLENWTKGADSVNLLTSRLADLQSRYVGSQGAFEQAETALRSRVSSLYLVQKAYPATRKSKPFRTLIVLGSVVITFALSVFLILLLELYRRRPSAITD